ncbi:MAG: STAS domain-containing protein [Halobacteriovoraceae bacterium]|nr:STAS domain-containing protein [Halobacteriovoraceae bacterium]
MSMKAHVRTDSRGNITIQMQGDLDFENTSPFKSELFELVENNPYSIITLDMNQLDFVGSCGIGQFVDTIRILNEKKKTIQLANVKSEFLKVFKLYDLDAFELMEIQFDTDETEHLSQNFAARRRTFEN